MCFWYKITFKLKKCQPKSYKKINKTKLQLYFPPLHWQVTKQTHKQTKTKVWLCKVNVYLTSQISDRKHVKIKVTLENICKSCHHKIKAWQRSPSEQFVENSNDAWCLHCPLVFAKETTPSSSSSAHKVTPAFCSYIHNLPRLSETRGRKLSQGW